MLKIGELIIVFDEEGKILDAYGWAVKIEGEYGKAWTEERLPQFFEIGGDKKRLLTDLKFYIDQFKKYLKEDKENVRKK